MIEFSCDDWFYFDVLSVDAGAWDGTLNPAVYLAKYILGSEIEPGAPIP